MIKISVKLDVDGAIFDTNNIDVVLNALLDEIRENMITEEGNYECGYCDELVDVICEECGNCPDCCDCATCTECGEIIDKHEGNFDGYCSACRAEEEEED